MTAGRHNAFGAMAVFTNRRRQLSWLYQRGDRDGTCKIAELVRAAAKYPNGSCTAVHIRQVQDVCENLP